VNAPLPSPPEGVADEEHACATNAPSKPSKAQLTTREERIMAGSKKTPGPRQPVK
jgi:hypothetical protein